jgi:hypothetical protein
MLHAFLERRPPCFTTFELAGLYQLLQFGTEIMDARWLVSLLAGFAPQPFRPAPDCAIAAAEALVRRGLAQLGGDTIEVGASLLPLCQGLGTAIPNAVLTMGSAGGPVSILLLVRGVAQFWTIEFYARPDGSPWARLNAMGGPAFQLYVESLAETWPKLGRVAPPPPAPPEDLWKTSALPQMPGARTSPAPVPGRLPQTPVGPGLGPALPSLVQCPVCRRELKAGTRFCGSCGTPLAGPR